MSTPKKYTSEKTAIIHIHGSPVLVSTLPQKIIQEFDMMDMMKAEADELLYKLEILSLAMKSKTSDINAMIEEHYAPKAQAVTP